MAWTSTTIVAPESTALAADRPVLVGSHIGDGCLPIWSSDTGLYSDTDRSHASGPAYFTCDRSAARRSYPSTTATQWWLVFDAFPAGTEFDCIALLNHNLTDNAGGNISVGVYRADDAAFTTNAATVTTISNPAARSVTFLSARISGSGSLKIGFVSLAAFTPQIGEVWIGRRSQLRGVIRTGRDVDGVASALAIGGTESQAQTASPLALGRRELDIAIQTLDNDSGLLDSSSLRTWWSDINYGQRPFLWVREPTTAPNEGVVMTTSASALELPREASMFDRPFSQSWKEQPPFLAAE